MYSTGLCPLRFPPGPLPKNRQKDEQKDKLIVCLKRLGQLQKGLDQPLIGLGQPLRGLGQILEAWGGADVWTDEWTYGRTDGMYRFPLYSTGLCPLRGCCPAHFKKLNLGMKQQGKGTDDHLLPLGDWF